MNWEGNIKQKKSETKDGYFLMVKYIDEDKYTWKVYYNKKQIIPFKSKPIFKKTMPLAKRQAIRLMVWHVLKKID